jgi:hypothetical protein
LHLRIPQHFEKLLNLLAAATFAALIAKVLRDGRDGLHQIGVKFRPHRDHREGRLKRL